MSKLSQRIRKATRSETPPVGFGLNARRQSTPTMLLLASLRTDQTDKAREALGRGADVLLFEGDAKALPGKLKDLGDVSVGLRLSGLQAATVTELREAGLDFAIFDAEAAADALLDEQFGYVLALPQDPTDTDLRIVESLPLDALLVPPPQGSLTVQGQLAVRRFFVLSRTPLLVEVQPDLSEGELNCLRDAGVAGVILDGRSDQALANLRRTIDGLPPPGRRREERAEAILPTATVTIAHAEEEEEGYPQEDVCRRP
jgi:hypothetical protein